MRIRQIALVARHLEPVLADLCAVFGLEISFRDPGVLEFGLHNGVIPIGDQFLEVVSPFRENTTAGRFLARRHGDSGYMVILQTKDLAADRRRFDACGVRVAWEVALEDIATVHLHPRDVGGTLVSVDQPEPPDSWRWAGPQWKGKARRDVVRGIRGVTIEATHPASMAERWAEVFALSPPHVRGDDVELALEDGTVRFAPATARGEGLAAVRLAATDAHAAIAAARERGLRTGPGRRIRIGGVMFELE